jgi:sulfhydrogenase subunit alpha
MRSKKTRTRTIEVGALARVEGHGALHLSVSGKRVVDLRLDIFEPPRFFEALLRGRDAAEAPDITARICGICPVAYQMSAVHALERIFGVAIDPAVRLLRRLYYAGEWIESHALHVHMLAAPDFLGCESIITLAEKDRAAVERGLRIKKAGNSLIALLGGRSVHPVGACIGGFTRAPRRREVEALRDDLLRARDDALTCLEWVAGFDLPDRSGDIEFVALRDAGEYPMNEGRIVSSRGIDCAQDDFDDAFEEHQVPHSTALHAKVKGRGPYFVGPLARLNLNFDRLPAEVAAAARATGVAWPSSNPYTSIVARAVEILYALEEALRIVDVYEPPVAPAARWEPRAGVGRAVTEAPRGILYQHYETDERGLVRHARIVPPTAQNQAQIEADLRDLAPEVLRLSKAEATHLCETAIRNYDPCISCAAHFLRLEIERLRAAPAASPSEPRGGARGQGRTGAAPAASPSEPRSGARGQDRR